MGKTPHQYTEAYHGRVPAGDGLGSPGTGGWPTDIILVSLMSYMHFGCPLEFILVNRVT